MLHENDIPYRLGQRVACFPSVSPPSIHYGRVHTIRKAWDGERMRYTLTIAFEDNGQVIDYPDETFDRIIPICTRT